MEKMSIEDEYDQSKVCVVSGSRAPLILHFNAQSKCTPRINLPMFREFRNGMTEAGYLLRATEWRLKDKQEEELKRTYERIASAKELNVEMVVPLHTLKEDYKSAAHTLKQIDSLLGQGLINVRRCRGDGNCYYRAFYYAYFELLIRKCVPFRSFLEMLSRRHDYPLLREIDNFKMFEVLTAICGQIYGRLTSGPDGVRRALQHLYQSVLLVPEFDYFAIKLIREISYLFLLEHRKSSYFGLELENAVIGDADSFAEYNEKIVRKMGEEARSVLLHMIPLIFRIKIETILLDPKSHNKDAYIERYNSSMEGFRSPLDPALDFRDDVIRLMFKPGHYDILYENVDIYDSEFQYLEAAIFENKEQLKSQIYAQNLKDKITTPCCKMNFERDEFRKLLVDTNVGEEGFGYSGSLQCICGRSLDRFDLNALFGYKEVDELQKDVREARANACAVCRSAVAGGDATNCRCGARYHVQCLKTKKIEACLRCHRLLAVVERKPEVVKAQPLTEVKDFKTFCCSSVFDFPEYITFFIEENKARRGESKQVAEDFLRCPLCDKVTNKEEIVQKYGSDAYEQIYSKLFAKVCPECNQAINSKDPVAKNDCGHHYHLFCAKFIIQSNRLICREPHCGASLVGLEEEVKRMAASICAECSRVAQVCARLECDHFICVDCVGEFCEKKSRLFSHQYFSARAMCRKCHAFREVTKITLSCKHLVYFSDLKDKVHRFKRDISYGPPSHDIELPACSQCRRPLSFNEINLVMGEDDYEMFSGKIAVLVSAKEERKVKQLSGIG